MGRTVINETENKQTIILNDSPEGIEGGYFDEDMVWHEFGEGGSVDSITPTLSMTVVNSTAEGYQISPNDETFIKVENNHLIYYGSSDLAVDYGETGVFETIIPVMEGLPSIFNPEIFLFHEDGVIYTVSDTVNCTVNEGVLLITDQSQNASCTLTYTLSE